MVLRQSQEAEYWTDKFRVKRDDIDYLFSQFLEEETPLTTNELALRLIRYRLRQEEDTLRKQIARGELFQPRNAYKVGQELIFPAFGYSVGKVVGERAGQNPEYGDFTVIEVEFEGSNRHEFASMLQKPHALNIDDAGGSMPSVDMPSAESIFEQYGETVIEELEAKLVDQEDAIFFAGKWFLRSLLLDINVGQLHLAEAVLDMYEGGPMLTSGIRKEIGMGDEGHKPELVEFSLDVAISNDHRFEDVGSSGQVQWYLQRLLPPEVLTTPTRLQFYPYEYDHSVLTPDLAALERELDDEWSELPNDHKRTREAMLTLIYPHRRVGSLPLTSRVDGFFPTAITSPRIRITFVDAQDGAEFAGWVVREGKYVYGLNEFYRKHRLPIGAYVTIRVTDDPSKLMIDFDAHRPRTEYIRLAQPVNNKITFANFKRSIGAGYDELLILGAEDLEGVDSVWQQTRDKRRTLPDIMRDLMPELAKLTPQNSVHAKTLYSAVNVVRRTPPGPIFALLVTRPEFEHVGGPYWRLSN